MHVFARYINNVGNLLKSGLNSSVPQADYLQEASLLMAKLCYVEGEYRDALGDLHVTLIQPLLD